jgi:Zn-dependent protease with chaperone function
MKAFNISALFFFLLLAIQIQANTSSRDADKEKLIELRLDSIAPSITPIFHAGTLAMDEGNLASADSLYSLVYKEVPKFDPVIRRLGSIRAQMGRVQEGIDLCEKAVALNRCPYNLLSLATCLTMSGGDVTNLAKARSVVNEAEKLSAREEYDFPALRAQIAIQLNDKAQLRVATEELLDKYPDVMGTHYFAAVLAVFDEKWINAKKEILKAQELGLDKGTVQGFLDSGVQSRAVLWHVSILFVWITIFWIIGLFLLFLVGKLLSNFTLRSFEQQNNIRELSGFENLLRSVYRWLINLSGFYYYVSLPIILVLLIVLVAGLIYVFLLIGHIPIQFTLMLIVGSCISIYGMVRSLLVKIKYSDPGRKLEEAEAPGLFKLTREVADTMGTRPIDEIRITPSTDLAVYERGTWKERLQDSANRILILGTGIIKDFKQDEFRAVLAHEYGHFSHRDTAGGDIALRVRNDMHKYFYALYYAGQNVWWNIAFQFLRLYNFIFRRISHGATRLQEVLADRVSAQTYGEAAFREGLTYVIRREIEFTRYANFEIEEAKKISRPFNNLYELTGNSESEIEEELKKALNQETTEDDTHPGPADRFRYIKGIGTAIISQENTYVRNLIVNWNSLTDEMTTMIENRVKEN